MEEDLMYEDDSSDNDDDLGIEIGMNDPSCSEQRTHEFLHDEEPNFKVLSPEEIVQHMVDCIKEVNQIVEVIIRCMMSYMMYECYFM